MDAVDSELVYTKLTELESRLQTRFDRGMDEVKQLIRDMGREVAEMRTATPSRKEHDELYQRVSQLAADLETHKREGHPDINTKVADLQAAGPRKFTMTTTLAFVIFGGISAVNTLINLVILLHK